MSPKNLALSLLLLPPLGGCVALPYAKVTVLDGENRALPGVPVTFSCTGGIELIPVVPIGAASPVAEVAPCHVVELQTDNEGSVEVHYWPPERPCWFARLFGASEPSEQIISVSYQGPSGHQVKCMVSVLPR